MNLLQDINEKVKFDDDTKKKINAEYAKTSGMSDKDVKKVAKKLKLNAKSVKKYMDEGLQRGGSFVDPTRRQFGSDQDREYQKKMNVNAMKDIATQMVHWASQEDDEDRALKVLMNELHRLLADKEAVR